jgi:hypothetical protein
MQILIEVNWVGGEKFKKAGGQKKGETIQWELFRS